MRPSSYSCAALLLLALTACPGPQPGGQSSTLQQTSKNATRPHAERLLPSALAQTAAPPDVGPPLPSSVAPASDAGGTPSVAPASGAGGTPSAEPAPGEGNAPNSPGSPAGPQAVPF